jgi:hypothetical protein
VLPSCAAHTLAHVLLQHGAFAGKGAWLQKAQQVMLLREAIAANIPQHPACPPNLGCALDGPPLVYERALRSRLPALPCLPCPPLQARSRGAVRLLTGAWSQLSITQQHVRRHVHPPQTSQPDQLRRRCQRPLARLAACPEGRPSPHGWTCRAQGNVWLIRACCFLLRQCPQTVHAARNLLKALPVPPTCQR